MLWLFLFRTRDFFRKPENYSVLMQAVGLAAAALLGWVVLALLLWAGGLVISMLLIAGLAGYVFYREAEVKRREAWIAAGHCSQCGYDLRKLPTAVCPECGHDTSPEEPTWRKRQREHQLRFGYLAAQPQHSAALPPPAAGTSALPRDLTPAPGVR